MHNCGLKLLPLGFTLLALHGLVLVLAMCVWACLKEEEDKVEDILTNPISLCFIPDWKSAWKVLGM